VRKQVQSFGSVRYALLLCDVFHVPVNDACAVSYFKVDSLYFIIYDPSIISLFFETDVSTMTNARLLWESSGSKFVYSEPFQRQLFSAV
jgi:hypothetical protein